MRFFALFSFILCLGLVQAKNCTVNEFKSSTGLCCKLCPAGQYMTKDCTGDTQTTCQACPNGEFTSAANNLTSCQKCRSGIFCGGGRFLVSCTPTSDVECKCPANKYYDTHTLRCGECTVCGRGERVVTPCETYKDATCEECPKGTYLDSVNGKCKLCSYCHKGEVVEEECAIWADTVCKREKTQVICPSQKADPPMPSTPTNLTPKLPTSVFPKTRSRSQKDDTSLPSDWNERRIFSDNVSWVFLGLNFVFIFVIFFLVLPRIKSCTSKIKTQTPNENVGRASPKASVVSNSKSDTIKENNIRFSTLPADVTEHLATYLNAKQGRNWKHLAGLMGYTSTFTQNLELTPVEATQKLIHNWEHRGSEATVYKLYCYLKELGRDDAIAVLWPYLTGRREEFV